MAEQRHMRPPDHARSPDSADPRQGAPEGVIDFQAKLDAAPENAVQPELGPQGVIDFQAKLDALQSQLTALEYLVKGQKVPGGLVALTVPIKAEEALHAVILELQRDRHFRDKVMTALGRLELKYKQGSLTALVRAIVGE